MTSVQLVRRSPHQLDPFRADGKSIMGLSPSNLKVPPFIGPLNSTLRPFQAKLLLLPNSLNLIESFGGIKRFGKMEKVQRGSKLEIWGSQIKSRIAQIRSQLLAGRVKSIVYNAKNCQYGFLGQHPLRITIFSELHLPNKVITSPAQAIQFLIIFVKNYFVKKHFVFKKNTLF